MTERARIIVISGPTASGKTDLAVEVARRLGTEVVSADARQFYRDIPIGTARPAPEDLQGVPHHFLGHLELDQDMSAAEFAHAALPVVKDVAQRCGTVVVAGGSGLYIDALVFAFDALPPADPKVRERLKRVREREGIGALQQELARLDPVTWQRIDRNNPQRLVRAIEVCLSTGRPMSEQLKGRRPRPGLDPVFFALDVPRATLYARIDARVDRMLEQGLVEEARRVYPHRERNALRTVGYRELFLHFDGQMDLPTAVALIKQHSRNYAKRQLSWLGRDAHWHWVPPDADRVLEQLH